MQYMGKYWSADGWKYFKDFDDYVRSHKQWPPDYYGERLMNLKKEVKYWLKLKQDFIRLFKQLREHGEKLAQPSEIDVSDELATTKKRLQDYKLIIEDIGGEIKRLNDTISRITKRGRGAYQFTIYPD